LVYTDIGLLPVTRLSVLFFISITTWAFALHIKLQTKHVNDIKYHRKHTNTTLKNIAMSRVTKRPNIKL